MKDQVTDRAPTTDELRSDIDSGRMTDKVAHPDPAAAPLGADAEAGGAPPDEQERRMAASRDRAVLTPIRIGEGGANGAPVLSLRPALAGAALFLLVGAFLVSLRLP